ncbi:MAG: tyrosine-protein phosphatase [Planctomycetes bacterium]|nr:tyrosine-protein phosphatase [Planctomycetota bacterium]
MQRANHALEPWQWWLWLTGLVGSRYDGLRHFSVVEPGVLLRCGQPRTRDLEQIRNQHGLRTIVCARGGTRHPLRGRWFRLERRWCAAAGVQLEHMPFSDKATPPADVFERFLTLLRDPQRRPLLVHCEQGFHRTGILVAAYRIALCGWSMQQAVDEMGSQGFQAENPKRAGLRQALAEWAGARQPEGSPIEHRPA